MGSPLKLKRRFRLRNSCNSITGWLPCRMHVSYTAFLRKTVPCCRERSYPRHRSRSTLVTSPRRQCCDRKSRAACAQSFTPWQQATRDHARNLSYIYGTLFYHTRFKMFLAKYNLYFALLTSNMVLQLVYRIVTQTHCPDYMKPSNIYLYLFSADCHVIYNWN